MSREIRRVPLDFNHPLNEVWPGFVSNEGGPCPETNKTCFLGQTPARAWLDAICHQFQTIAEESTKTPAEIAHFARSGRIFPHPYLEMIPNAPRVRADRGPHPLAPLSKDFVELYKRVSGDLEIGSFLHSYSGAMANALIKAAGFDERWGICPVCEGHADDPSKRAAADAWKPTPPPSGPGFQIWESVSEGSPISPVFKTELQMERWLIESGHTPRSARAFIEDGFVPSAVAVDGVFYEGIEGAGR